MAHVKKFVRYFKSHDLDNFQGSTYSPLTTEYGSANTAYVWHNTESNRTSYVASRNDKSYNDSTGNGRDGALPTGIHERTDKADLCWELISQDPGNVASAFPYKTFSSIDDAKSAIGIDATCLNTSSPTVTYELADSDQTLKVISAFNNNTELEANRTAWNNKWADVADGTGTKPYADNANHIKTEFLNDDDSVSFTTDPKTGNTI